ncbi:hypothetical protein K461DRAFT_265393 [Myriangium duriaei CBS 260.36]|uniref:Pentacotripeptide-repeat region of PRORP domain-containing protein n=1 Tax=Myriangium duriaei CBS 260.36 TaxID=1168546 RepID=A0A9P4J8A1_9PEZI|nr:hypothetical protein K461DRAFT_265393 [Myriangium duriaei CBS 260.36]
MCRIENRARLTCGGLRKYDANIDSKEFHDTVVELFPPQDRPALAQALERERTRRRELANSVDISLERSPLASPILRELNKLLRQAAGDVISFKSAAELWKWYLRAVRNIPGVHAHIPTAAWNILWRTQITEDMPLELRKQRVLELVGGITKADLPLSSEQTEAKLEALVLSGKDREAVLEWEHDFKSTEGRDSDNLRHGVKLFAAMGDIRNGVSILKKYQEVLPNGDPRIMHTLIAACIQTQNDHMAYSLYLSLRQRLDTNIQAKDFDLISARFLAHERLDLALAVFRDMMMVGTEMIERGTLTVKEETKMLDGMMDRVDTLQSRGRKSDEVNKISLEVLTHLPKQWTNKFFFGKWIKKLIGMDDLESAAKVIELMYQRGIEPSTTHVNGLIGGLLRSNLPEQMQRGETLAWSMIHKKLEDVARRRDEHEANAAKRLEGLSDQPQLSQNRRANDQFRIPLDLARPVPKASMETFNVLGLYYLLKSNWTYLGLLGDMVDPAGLKMSPFFMNHLLYMHLYATGPDNMWNNLLKLSEKALPDIDTYDVLWHAQQMKGETNVKRSASKLAVEGLVPLPPPRSSFAMMVRWYDLLDPRKQAKAKEGFGEELYARIMSAFSGEKDFPCVLVALHGIFSVFAVAPSEPIKEIIITGLANLMEPVAPQIKVGRRVRQQLAADRSRVRSVRLALGLIRDRRKERMLRNGVDPEEFDGKAKALEEVNLLSELIRSVLVRVHRDANQVEILIQAAREEMGVGELSVGDVNAASVDDDFGSV